MIGGEAGTGVAGAMTSPYEAPVTASGGRLDDDDEERRPELAAEEQGAVAPVGDAVEDGLLVGGGDLRRRGRAASMVATTVPDVGSITRISSDFQTLATT